MEIEEEEFSEPFISVEQMPMWGDYRMKHVPKQKL